MTHEHNISLWSVENVAVVTEAEHYGYIYPLSVRDEKREYKMTVYETYPLKLVMYMSTPPSSWSGHGCIGQSVLKIQNNTDNMCVSLSPVVVAVEPLVRGLKKLPEDIDWSYSGLYESIFNLFHFLSLKLKTGCHVTVTQALHCWQIPSVFSGRIYLTGSWIVESIRVQRTGKKAALYSE